MNVTKYDILNKWTVREFISLLLGEMSEELDPELFSDEYFFKELRMKAKYELDKELLRIQRRATKLESAMMRLREYELRVQAALSVFAAPRSVGVGKMAQLVRFLESHGPTSREVLLSNGISVYTISNALSSKKIYKKQTGQYALKEQQ